jgi:hypothetical protein
VPTLLLTPEDDKLVGTQAAQEMLAGIPDVTEIVLPRTGHVGSAGEDPGGVDL